MKQVISNILITRSRNSVEHEFALIFNLVNEVIFFPTIKIVQVKLSEENRKVISHFNQFDYIIFTSANGVKFFSNFFGEKSNAEKPKGKVVAVGSKTAEAIKSIGWSVNIIPEEFTAEGLLEELEKENLNGKSVLIPGSANSRDVLQKGLKSKGADAIFVPIYKSVTRDVDKQNQDYNFIIRNKPDVFVFTSPSSVDGFAKIFNLKNLGEYFENKIIIAIGSVTKNHLNKLGVNDILIPDKFTIEGVVILLTRILQRRIDEISE